jgi:hypothetical protein
MKKEEQQRRKDLLRFGKLLAMSKRKGAVSEE